MLIYGLAIIGGVTALLVMNFQHPAMYLTISGLFLTFLVSVALVLGRMRRLSLAENHYQLRRTESSTESADNDRHRTMIHIDR